MLLLIGLLIIGCTSLVIWGLHPDMAKRHIQRRVYSELADRGGQSRLRWLRALAPLVWFNKRFNKGHHHDQELTGRFTAGRVPLQPMEFLVMKQLSMGLAVLLYLFAKDFRHVELVGLIIWAAIGFIIPEIWLRSRIAARRGSIARDLPEVVDLLSLCVEAGADFMNAMQRVVREYRRCPLREELALVLQEVHVGKRRREAFRALSDRVQVPDVTAFSRTLIHADRMGTGMVQALRILSEDTRLRRYNQAERFAQQAPLKMLIPLFFVMASVLLIVAGPVMLQFLRGDLFPTNL